MIYILRFVSSIMRRTSIRSFVLMALATSIVIITIVEIINMKKSENVIASLENKIDFIDKTVWVAVAVSVGLSGLLFSYKSKLADEQKKEISAQQERIAQIELNIATANKIAEEAKSETEKERQKRLELQRAIAPREINITELASSLSKFKNFGILIHRLADIETGILVEQFKDTLNKTEIRHRDGFIMTITSSSQYIGIKIYGNTSGLPEDSELIRFINTISSYFIKHGIQAEVVNAPLSKSELSQQAIEIQFGLKPLVKINP